jgi:hypothetical protein
MKKKQTRESKVGYPAAAADNTRTKYTAGLFHTGQDIPFRDDLGNGIRATATPKNIIITFGKCSLLLTASNWLKLCEFATRAGLPRISL